MRDEKLIVLSKKLRENINCADSYEEDMKNATKKFNLKEAQRIMVELKTISDERFNIISELLDHIDSEYGV